MHFLSSTFKNKKVLVTGHTGFKGSWLSCWLLQLGAKVYGISNQIPTTPALFQAAKLEQHVQDLRIDIRNEQEIIAAFNQIKPDFVFHLAAQALVKKSYSEPVLTFETNVNGSINILEGLKSLQASSNNLCTAIMITSDKVYDNVEWVWGYKETDALGGKDPYSASKAAAELAIKTYLSSYLNKPDQNLRLAIARAGNVIGGGDWAADRIIPDAIRAWTNNQQLEIRSPQATRPWQHVLEPLSGYLHLASKLSSDPKLHGEAFNFGPHAENVFSVSQLLDQMRPYWTNPESAKWLDTSQTKQHQHEARLLKLNCDKALFFLDWLPNLGFKETIKFTMDWYREFYSEPSNTLEFTNNQIKQYENLATQRNLVWAKTKQ